MVKIQERVQELLSSLYPKMTVDYISQIAQCYVDRKLSNPNTIPVPESLHDVTNAREMSDPIVEVDENKFNMDIFKKIGIVGDGVIIGPLNHILTRMLTIPRMLSGYIENYPTDPDELQMYTDPPMLQIPVKNLTVMYDAIFSKASNGLAREGVLLEKFKLLGEIGEHVAQEVESVYPANGSTQAYELFGIFHLFPSNKTVDLTSTSPGVILPTEADPLRFKDSVVILKKNLLRPTYFEMLRHSIDIGDGRIRRYSANREGTAKNLKAYPKLSGAAKEILSDYLKIKDKFEIRLGEQDPRMKLATLIGDIGIVYSVRDKKQKSKIAHNITVIDPKEATRWRAVFEEQWEKGEPITSIDIVDELIKA